MWILIGMVAVAVIIFVAMILTDDTPYNGRPRF